MGSWLVIFLALICATKGFSAPGQRISKYYQKAYRYHVDTRGVKDEVKKKAL